MQRSQPKSRTMNAALMRIVTVICLLGALGISLAGGYYSRKMILKSANERLFSAVEFAHELHGADFHDRITGEDSLSREQFERILDRHDAICRRLGLQYIWSVLVIGDRIIFTTATRSNVNDPASAHAHFFETHRDPLSFDDAMGTPDVPVYSSFHNEWGAGRQVLVPRLDSHNRRYITGASIQLDELNNLVMNAVWLALIAGVALFALVWPLAGRLTRRITGVFSFINTAAVQMAKGDLDVALPVSGISEARQVCNTLDSMRRELKGRMEELESFFTLNLDLVCIADMEGNFIKTNQGWSAILGYSAEDLNKTKLLEFIHPDDMHATLNAMSDLGRCEEVLNLTNRYRAKDGSYRYIEWHLRPKDNLIYAVARDITQRKQGDEALLRERERLASILEGTHVGTWEWNVQTGETIFNERWAEIIGYSLEEISPLTIDTWMKFSHPDDLKASGELLQKHFSGELHYYECEARMRHKNGEWVWVLDRGKVAVSTEDGKPLHMMGTHQDITERKQAENKLRVAHEKMLTILDSIESTVYVADMDTYEILFMNKKMITDFSGDKTGEICFSAFRKKLEPCEFCTNDQLLDKNGNPAGVCTWHDQNPITGKFYINHDRAIEWVDSRMVRLQIATDITDLKKMETQLTQAQKMESIGTLAGGIAHDFNNILFPIVGHTEMLMDDLSEENSSIRESLNQIYTGALRARDLVKQILAFAREEKDELKLMKMQPIVKEAMKLIRSSIPTTISITQHLNPDCGPVTADPTQIHQIVMNLVTNAYHAMEENGGELKVNLKEIELGRGDLIDPDMSPGLYACLTIADTGAGMDKEVMNRIFDPFFTTKEKGKGTGMGLAVVHGIVKRMSGEIQVYSEPGKGTQFHIYLPLAESVKKQQVTKVEAPIQGGTEHILLVDDEEAILKMEKQALERLGYQVTSLTSSLEALEAFRAAPGKFDMVITDMAMPNMSGDKLSIELTKIRPDIPVLLCTGFSETMTEERIKSLGIRGLLLKPIIIRDLAKKMREVLDGNDI